MPPSIAIVGAGPAGLTLARLLLLSPHPINFTIFEHDASPHSRAFQGGCLDLHPAGGLKALKAMELEEQAAPLLRYEGEELVIADLNGCELVHMTEAAGTGERASAPEVDREKLKELILGAVGQERVKWGKHLVRVDEEKRQLEFRDGSVEGPFDLVVGADGAWSKVRNVLTDVKPVYSGVGGFEARIERPDEQYPEISKLIGKGSYFAYSGGRSCNVQRQDDKSYKIGLWVKREEAFIDELSPGDAIDQEVLKLRMLAEYKDWAPELRHVIKTATLTRKWKLWELPVGTTWDHRKGFTLLGDAAHLATPFAGLGVNAAMSDCMDLADQINDALANGSSLDGAVEKYEKLMFPRALKVQQDTMRNKIGGFADDGPIGLISKYIGVFAEESGYPLDKGLLSYVPVTRSVYGLLYAKSCLHAVRKWVINALGFGMKV
jgi:2-polyprenyl-6-methoxyphenol hydroxylase-like FAD-dependent oxidoreductase